MELCFWFISSKGKKKKKRIIYDCIAIPIKRLLHCQRKHEEVARHEFLGVLSQINDWGSWWCAKQWNSDHCKQKNWYSCKEGLTRTWLNFSVNSQSHFIYKDPFFLSAQRHLEVSHTSKHWMGFWRCSIITESWLLMSWVSVSQRMHSAIEGVFMGYFGETQTRSGISVPEVWIWRDKQKTGFVTNSWLPPICSKT